MLQKAIKLNSEDKLKAEIYGTLGGLYQDQKLYDKAIAAYQEKNKLMPKDTNALERLAHLYRRTAQHEKELLIYEKLVKLGGRNFAAYKSQLDKCREKLGK